MLNLIPLSTYLKFLNCNMDHNILNEQKTTQIMELILTFCVQLKKYRMEYF
jgi:NADPH-dependent 7-cyano-7-deazaguanine reductase QueF